LPFVTRPWWAAAAQAVAAAWSLVYLALPNRNRPERGMPADVPEAVISQSRIVRTIIHCASAGAADPLGSRLVRRVGLLLIRRGRAS
jgi:hypothetical protein